MELDEETEAELQELVERLDGLVPRAGARLALPAERDGSTTVGNRLGYLRLAVELLRAALRPVPEDDELPTRVVPRLEGLLTPDSGTPFALCELDESIVSRPPAQSRFGALGQIGIGVVLVLIVVVAFVGLALLWRWTLG